MSSSSQFLEFDPEQFPIRIEAYNTDGQTVWWTQADSPGGLTIPSMRDEHGPVGVRVFCNGELDSDTPPPDEEYLRDLDERMARGEEL